jgi:hypothetical protein
MVAGSRKKSGAQHQVGPGHLKVGFVERLRYTGVEKRPEHDGRKVIW